MAEPLYIRHDDFVHVRARVNDLAPMNGPTVGVTFRGKDGDAPLRIAVLREDVVHVEPRPLAVGDRVSHQTIEPDFVGTIVHINEDRAWVRWDRDLHSTPKLCDLERVS